MIGNHFLLDTNIIIALFANQSTVIEKIKTHEGMIMIPSIVIGELFYGAELSSKKESNIKRIEDLSRTTPVLNCDASTARHYGSIKSNLKLKVTPIPENDIWIAALALQNNLTLITRDHHFNHIALKIDNW